MIAKFAYFRADHDKCTDDKERILSAYSGSRFYLINQSTIHDYILVIINLRANESDQYCDQYILTFETVVLTLL